MDFRVSIILLSSGPSVKKSPQTKNLDIFLSFKYSKALFNKYRFPWISFNIATFSILHHYDYNTNFC